MVSERMQHVLVGLYKEHGHQPFDDDAVRQRFTTKNRPLPILTMRFAQDKGFVTKDCDNPTGKPCWRFTELGRQALKVFTA